MKIGLVMQKEIFNRFVAAAPMFKHIIRETEPEYTAIFAAAPAGRSGHCRRLSGRSSRIGQNTVKSHRGNQCTVEN